MLAPSSRPWFARYGEDHRLRRAGLYKHVRRPAYTGAPVARHGLGLSFSNRRSPALSVVPYAAAAAFRIRLAERALREAFGDEYESYAKSTKRLTT